MAISSNAARPIRRRRADGERTHTAILEVATRVASVEGLHGLTIGRLAEELGVSKSGLYAHFGSKEQLQLETIDAALSIFEAEVVAPVLQAPEGLVQLESYFEAYFSYLERGVFPGGCFFAALLAEMDARSGPVHDKVVSIEQTWREELWQLGREAQRTGEIRADIDVKQLAFELYACLELANYHFVLFREPEVLERGRRAVAGIMERARGESRRTSRA
ncbi:MAG: TetR/AcrR family transcriptional regulator [Actinomycetota bacterium]